MWVMSRVGLIGVNSVGYVNALLDIWNSGDCAVLMDWRVPPSTALSMLAEAGVERCFAEADLCKKYTSADGVIFLPYERQGSTTVFLPKTVYEKFSLNYSCEEAVVLYSSGTTGSAKGIILSHFAIQSNADAVIDYMHPGCGDCFYIAKALTHASTFVGEMLVALKVGAGLVLSPTVKPPRVALKSINQFNVTIIGLNPTLLKMYAEEFGRETYNISSLRVVYTSGAILSSKVCVMAREAFGDVPVYNVYGMTEAGPRITAQVASCCDGNSVGRPIKGVEVVIVDDAGKVVPAGEKGIVHINSPSLFNGYVTGKEKVAPLYKDWLNSGDIGYFDTNGALYIVDRVDDVIIIDSHKVYPSEVEHIILQVPGVVDCVVNSATDERGDLFLSCMYVGCGALKGYLRKFCLERLSAYEVPRRFVQIDFIGRDAKGRTAGSNCTGVCFEERKHQSRIN